VLNKRRGVIGTGRRPPNPGVKSEPEGQGFVPGESEPVQKAARTREQCWVHKTASKRIRNNSTSSHFCPASRGNTGCSGGVCEPLWPLHKPPNAHLDKGSNLYRSADRHRLNGPGVSCQTQQIKNKLWVGIYLQRLAVVYLKFRFNRAACYLETLPALKSNLNGLRDQKAWVCYFLS
jgi:hypothetical protein